MLINLSKYLKSSFIKNSLAYSGTHVFGQFIRLARELIVRRILPPEIMGFWSFVAVVQSFIGTFDLGCITGAGRELPIMKGRQGKEEEDKIRSTTLWFTLLQNIFIGIFALLYIWWNRANYVPWELIATCVGIALFVIMGFQSSYMTFFTGAQAFVPLSKLLLIGTIIEGISFPLCAYVWGLSGIMVMAVISSTLRAGLFFFYGNMHNLHVQLKIFKNILKRLLSFGFFIRLVDYPYALFCMVNILWVTKFMSIEALALFAMARGFFLQVSDISARFSTIYAMRFLEQAGRGTSSKLIAIQMKQFLIVQLLVVVPLLTWLAGIVLPLIVRNFIPKYKDANQAILILLMCCFFYVVNSGLTNPWVRDKKVVARGIANVFALIAIVTALSVTWFILGRQTINDVAYATLTGNFLYFVYMVIAVGKDLWQPRECAEIILSVTLAAIWVFFILSKGYTSVVEQAEFSENLKATLFMGGWTFLAILPVPLYGLKRSHILKGWRQ
jgi:O-antigen/teichoic acid export membrane protein